ncbi:MFS transporter [Schaalia vaccimaxillae]|uniref:MFS transporter n=1 Tax=Schaalia vaccimaxillae TaxID=183916 RepID=UPI0003B79027|nr:MFS transporter [Schaalia vaccimaxillae]
MNTSRFAEEQLEKAQFLAPAHNSISETSATPAISAAATSPVNATTPPALVLEQSDATAPTGRWTFFAVISLGLLMIGLDNSILYTALPQLVEQLHANQTQQLWIINAYALVLAGLLLGTGTLGDRIGHRRMFLTGLVIFGLGSLIAAFAPTAWALITARAFLGLGASIMMPATLALIRLTFSNEVERNTAIGIWGSVAVVGAAAGPTVGGFLLEHFWWGSVFLINVPIVVIAIILTVELAPKNVPNPDKNWDFVSSLYALVTLASLVMVIKSAANSHWQQAGIAAGIFLIGALAFVIRQRRLDDPLLTFDIFRSRIFAGGVLAAGGAMFALAGMEMLTTQKLQLVDQFTPLEAGLAISAMAIAAFPASTLGGANLHRVGFLPLISGGFVVIATGLIMAWWAGRHNTFPLFLAAMILSGTGAGLVMSVSSTAIIGSALLHRTGMAAGVEEVSYEFGTLLSVAITGSMVPLLMERRLPADLRERGIDALYDPATRQAAAVAYESGYLTVVGILAVVVVALAAATAWCFRGNLKSGGNGAAH